jgi:hypothetical protein
MKDQNEDRPNGEEEAEPRDPAAPSPNTEQGVSARPAIGFPDSPVMRQIIELTREGMKHIT